MEFSHSISLNEVTAAPLQQSMSDSFSAMDRYKGFCRSPEALGHVMNFVRDDLWAMLFEVDWSVNCAATADVSEQVGGQFLYLNLVMLPVLVGGMAAVQDNGYAITKYNTPPTDQELRQGEYAFCEGQIYTKQNEHVCAIIPIENLEKFSGHKNYPRLIEMRSHGDQIELTSKDFADLVTENANAVQKEYAQHIVNSKRIAWTGRFLGASAAIPTWDYGQVLGIAQGQSMGMSTISAGYYASMYTGLFEGATQTALITALNTCAGRYREGESLASWDSAKDVLINVLKALPLGVTIGAVPGAVWQLVYNACFVAASAHLVAGGLAVAAAVCAANIVTTRLIDCLQPMMEKGVAHCCPKVAAVFCPEVLKELNRGAVSEAFLDRHPCGLAK